MDGSVLGDHEVSCEQGPPRPMAWPPRPPRPSTCQAALYRLWPWQSLQDFNPNASLLASQKHSSGDTRWPGAQDVAPSAPSRGGLLMLFRQVMSLLYCGMP